MIFQEGETAGFDFPLSYPRDEHGFIVGKHTFADKGPNL